MALIGRLDPWRMRVRWVSGVAVAGHAGRLVGAPAVWGVGRRRLAGGAWRAVVVVGGVLGAAALVGGVVGERGSVRAVRGPRAVVVPPGLEVVAQRVIGASDREFWVRHRGGVLVASGGGVSSVFGSGEVRVRVTGGMVGLRLVAVGYGAAPAGASRAVAPIAAGDLVRYRRGGLVEWYRNGPFGLEQGFTLARRLAGGGEGPLMLALGVDGSLLARGSSGGVLFVSRSGVVRLRYGALRVTDAVGRQLRASLALSRGRLMIRVWDRGARYPVAIDPFIQQGAKLVGDCTGSCSGPSGTGETAGAGFGESVALSGDGDTALIGAYFDHSGGAAWVFTQTGGVWRQQGTKLIGDCTSACSGPNGTGETGVGQFGGGFGSSVALSGDGDTALIGAPGDSGDAGGAWLFTRSGSTWSQQGTNLIGDCTSACAGPNGTGETGEGDFGSGVALSGDGDTALIGAPGDSDDAGGAWLFTRSGSTWSQQGTKLIGDCTSACAGPNGTGEAGEGDFGSGVALSGDGDTALIGAPGDSGDAGGAWLFTRSGSTWSQQGTKLIGDCTSACAGPNGTGEAGEGDFGSGVALSSDGDTALISAPFDNSPGSLTSIRLPGDGAVWAFTRSGSAWSQQGAKLIGDCTGACSGPNGTGGTRYGGFGRSVAVSGDGDTALIGASCDGNCSGAAWVFTRAGSTWSQQGAKLIGDCTSACSGPNGTGETGEGYFGYSATLSGDGNTALIGAPGDSIQAGGAWAFTTGNALSFSLLVSIAGAGSGGVSGTGISCPGTCSESLPNGSAVTLTATPTAGSTFAGWSDGCSGAGSCRLQLNSDTRVTATFNKPNRFTIAHLHTYADGRITFAVKVPGPGTVDVLETAWNDNLARVATLLQPAAHRFVFARAHTSARGATTIPVSVSPNVRGRLLVHHHTYRVTLRLWVTYTPVAGRSHSVGIYGLHLPACPDPNQDKDCDASAAS